MARGARRSSWAAATTASCAPTFIIGKDGRLLHVMDKVKTKTHHDDVLALLRTAN